MPFPACSSKGREKEGRGSGCPLALHFESDIFPRWERTSGNIQSQGQCHLQQLGLMILVDLDIFLKFCQMVADRKEKTSKRPNVKQHSTGLAPSFSVPLYLHRAALFLIFKMCQKHRKFPKLYVWGYFCPVTFRDISECSYNKRISVQSHQFTPHGNQEPVDFNVHTISA